MTELGQYLCVLRHDNFKPQITRGYSGASGTSALMSSRLCSFLHTIRNRRLDPLWVSFSKLVLTWISGRLQCPAKSARYMDCEGTHMVQRQTEWPKPLQTGNHQNISRISPKPLYCLIVGPCLFCFHYPDFESKPKKARKKESLKGKSNRMTTLQATSLTKNSDLFFFKKNQKPKN